MDKKPHQEIRKKNEEDAGTRFYRMIFGETKRKWNIPRDLYNSIQIFITRAGGALRTSEKYGIDKENSSLYSIIKNSRDLFEGIHNKEKIDKNPDKVKTELSVYNIRLQELIDINRNAVWEAQQKKQNTNWNYSMEDNNGISLEDVLSKDTPLKRHETYSEGKFLLSKNELESRIAEEIVITRAYYRLFDTVKIERAGIKDSALAIVETGLANMPRETTSFEHISKVNQYSGKFS